MYVNDRKRPGLKAISAAAKAQHEARAKAEVAARNAAALAKVAGKA